MKLQLIMLPNQPILVSDEEIKEGDWCYYPKNKKPFKVSTYIVQDWLKKIIAGIQQLPSINFSALSEEDYKKIGWVDVEKEFEKWENTIPNRIKTVLSDFALSHTYPVRGILRNMFKTAQSLNEKKFSEEDLIKAYLSNGPTDEKGVKSFIQSLSQPKVFDVEVEMEYKDGFGNWYLYDLPVENFEPLALRPKITNNSIKILKIL